MPKTRTEYTVVGVRGWKGMRVKVTIHPATPKKAETYRGKAQCGDCRKYFRSGPLESKYKVECKMADIANIHIKEKHEPKKK